MEFDSGNTILYASGDKDTVTGSLHVSQTNVGIPTNITHSHPNGGLSNVSTGDIYGASRFPRLVNNKSMTFNVYEVRILGLERNCR